MSLSKIANVVGLLQIFLALSMVLTGIVAALYGDGDAAAFFQSGSITVLIGWGVYRATRFSDDVTVREGFAIVTMAWTATALFGSLPYLLTGVLTSPTAAFFEAMSGFTTTGASVFTGIEALKLGKGEVDDGTGSRGGAVDGLIVKKHGNAVAAEVHIELEHGGSGVEGATHGLNGLLRTHGCTTTMGNDGWLVGRNEVLERDGHDERGSRGRGAGAHHDEDRRCSHGHGAAV